MKAFTKIKRALWFVLGLLAALPALHGQDQSIDFDRPEAWAMRYFAGVALMQGNGPPPGLEAGHFSLGLELANVPHLSRSERRVGFNGTKVENLNKTPVLARPLLHYGITDRLSLTATYVPPIEVIDRLQTHLAGLSVNYRVIRRGSFLLTLRAIGQWSSANGDFTVSEEVAGDPDPERNPYGGIRPSDDTFTSWTASLEAGAEYRLPTDWPLFLVVNAAYTYADLEFEVDALRMDGFHDNSVLSTTGGIWSFGAGIRARLTESVSASLGITHVPLDVRRPPDFESRDESLTHLRLVVNVLL